jgi:hypothetical protein
MGNAIVWFSMTIFVTTSGFPLGQPVDARVGRQDEEVVNVARILARIRGRLLAQFVKNGMTEDQVSKILGDDFGIIGIMIGSGSFYYHDYHQHGLWVTFVGDKRGIQRVSRISPTPLFK